MLSVAGSALNALWLVSLHSQGNDGVRQNYLAFSTIGIYFRTNLFFAHRGIIAYFPVFTVRNLWFQNGGFIVFFPVR